MKVLVVAADPTVRDQIGLAVRGAERKQPVGEQFELIEASDGLRAISAAWKHMPDVVVADEITSRAGAFALTRELKGAATPFPGKVVILLERSQDEWLAEWARADAWFVKPVDPFALADAVSALVAGATASAQKEAG